MEGLHETPKRRGKKGEDETMIETVSEWQFIDAFMKIRPDNFTRSGLQALYDYIIELEDDIGEQIEFDVIALCCDFTQYESLEELNNEYDGKFKDLEHLADYTQVIEFDDGIIIQAF